jgi:NCS1 family nucleobase:cation symporter-1
VPALGQLTGFAWLLGAAIGAALHFALMRSHARLPIHDDAH